MDSKKNIIFFYIFWNYILVNQYQYAIEQFSKNEQQKWVLTEEKGENALLNLTTLNLKLSFADIYERVTFTDDQELS